MNVSVKAVDVPDGKGGEMRKRILVVTKDFNAGDLIYKVMSEAQMAFGV